MSAEEISGWLAAIFTTLIFVPQLHKAFTTKKTQDLSMLMIVLAILGNSAWFVQALLTSNTPLMVCAVLIIIMSSILIYFKYHNDKKQ
ncbi:MAG: PQ-loop repeat-containing protein [Gammaproteobacteria bacterium]|nr:PQ-loop repeat-containing protein [Gammaproteobacteria bacterium]